MYVNGEVKFALDGNATDFARPLVDYGEHVLSFVVSGFDRRAGILMFAATVETRPKGWGRHFAPNIGFRLCRVQRAIGK
jgi:hypothetical protein